jgi:hypothetical protein
MCAATAGVVCISRPTRWTFHAALCDGWAGETAGTTTSPVAITTAESVFTGSRQ